MSYSVTPLQTFVVLDPRTSVYREKQYAILKGARQVSWQQVLAQTNTSTTQITFNCPPPNAGFLVDPKFLVRAFVQINFTGTGTPVLLQLGTGDGFRQFPLNSCVTVTQVTLNNGTFSVNTNEVLPALLTMGGTYMDFDHEYSASPSMPDTYQNYGDWVNYGQARNPLAQYGANPHQIPRGGFPLNVITNTPTSASIQAVITENLFVPPLKWGSNLSPAFIGLTNVTVQLTMGDMSRMWSHDANGSTMATPVVTFYNSPQMLFQYLTPQLAPAIPKEIPYPYKKISFTVSPGSSLAPNASVTISGSNIQYGTIPKAIILFGAIRLSQRTFQTSDAWPAINNVNLFWNGMNGYLSGATQQELHKMALQNGSQLDWGAFSFYRGSVLPIAPGKDIGLDATEAPGLGGSYNLQPTVTITNVNQSQTYIYDLYVVAIEEGIVTIAEQNAVTQTGVLSPLDVINSKDSPTVEYQQVQQYFGGGDFYGNLRSFFGKVAKGAESALPYLESAVPGLSACIPAARKLLGVGMSKRKKLYESGESIGSDPDYDSAVSEEHERQIASAYSRSIGPTLISR